MHSVVHYSIKCQCWLTTSLHELLDSSYLKLARVIIFLGNLVSHCIFINPHLHIYEVENLYLTNAALITASLSLWLFKPPKTFAKMENNRLFLTPVNAVSCSTFSVFSQHVPQFLQLFRIFNEAVHWSSFAKQLDVTFCCCIVPYCTFGTKQNFKTQGY